MAIIQIQWFVWGYSLTYSQTGATAYIGNLANAGFRNIFTLSNIANTTASATDSATSLGASAPNTILGKTAAVYGSMYACVTGALLIGAIADRGRVLPAMVFLFVWATIVYAPIACWSWNPNGWAAKLGYLDYAGGTPVHITAGYGALAYSLMLGKRAGMDAVWSSTRWIRFRRLLSRKVRSHHSESDDYNTSSSLASEKATDSALLALDARPHSVLLVVLGTALMWAGWMGFNAGASIVPTLRTLQAVINTNISGAMAGITWMLLDFRMGRKWSVVGFCSGVISGLVAITPAAGFVPAWSALIFGLVGGAAANGATKVKFLLGIDDALDIFAVHGIGGVTGNILTALFASKSIAALDTVTVIKGGWLDHHYVQLWFQIAGTLASSAYAFVMTAVLLFLIGLIPGLQLRVSRTADEAGGLDLSQHDEFAYDYVELVPDLPCSASELWPMIGGGQATTTGADTPGVGGVANNFHRSDDGKYEQAEYESSPPKPGSVHSIEKRSKFFRFNKKNHSAEKVSISKSSPTPPTSGPASSSVPIMSAITSSSSSPSPIPSSNTPVAPVVAPLSPSRRYSALSTQEMHPDDPLAPVSEQHVTPSDSISPAASATATVPPVSRTGTRPSYNRSESSGVVPLLRRSSNISEIVPDTIPSPLVPTSSYLHMHHHHQPIPPTSLRMRAGGSTENLHSTLSSGPILGHRPSLTGSLTGGSTSYNTPSYSPITTNFSPAVPSSLRRISRSGSFSDSLDNEEDDSTTYARIHNNLRIHEEPILASGLSTPASEASPNPDDTDRNDSDPEKSDTNNRDDARRKILDDQDQSSQRTSTTGLGERPGRVMGILSANRSGSTMSSYMLDGSDDRDRDRYRDHDRDHGNMRMTFSGFRPRASDE